MPKALAMTFIAVLLQSLMSVGAGALWMGG
jgi:hypothetical protein